MTPNPARPIAGFGRQEASSGAPEPPLVTLGGGVRLQSACQCGTESRALPTPTFGANRLP
jgi:hypothetical protein